MKRINLNFSEGRAAFTARFSARTPNPIPEAYLAQCACVGFADKGELIGGYLMNLTIPHRYVDMIPEPARGADTQKYLADGACVELACMWMDRDLITPGQRMLVYGHALYDSLTAGRKWIVCGTVTAKVGDIHKLGFRRQIYRGPMTFPGQPHGEIYAASRAEILRRIPAAYFRDRARRRKRAQAAPDGDTKAISEHLDAETPHRAPPSRSLSDKAGLGLSKNALVQADQTGPIRPSKAAKTIS